MGLCQIIHPNWIDLSLIYMLYHLNSLCKPDLKIQINLKKLSFQNESIHPFNRKFQEIRIGRDSFIS